MHDEQKGRLTDVELPPLFDRLFPHSFAGADVLAEVAPDAWDRSPLLACFHPSVERVFEESVQLYISPGVRTRSTWLAACVSPGHPLPSVGLFAFAHVIFERPARAACAASLKSAGD